MTQEVLDQRKLQKLEKAGIKVLPAAVRYSRSGRRGMRAAAAVVIRWFWSCLLTDRYDGNLFVVLFGVVVYWCCGLTFGFV